MAYEPQTNYIGGQLISQGLSNFGSGIAGGIEGIAKLKLAETEQKNRYNDMIFQAALQNGAVTPEDYKKYITADATQKTGMAANWGSSFVEGWRQKQQQAELERRKTLAETNYYIGRAASELTGGGVTNLTDEEKARALAARKIPVRAGPNSFLYYDIPGNTSNDPTKWKQITLSNSNIKAVVDEAGNIVPNSKLQGVLHPSQQSEFSNSLLKPTPTPTPGPGILDRIGGWFGAAGTPTPAPAAAAPASAPAAPTGTAPAADAQTQAAAIKQQYQAGQISHDQAVQQLQALGYQ